MNAFTGNGDVPDPPMAAAPVQSNEQSRFRHSMRSAGARIGGKDIGAPVTAEKQGTRRPRAELITSRRRRTVTAEPLYSRTNKADFDMPSIERRQRLASG